MLDPDPYYINADQQPWEILDNYIKDDVIRFFGSS